MSATPTRRSAVRRPRLFATSVLGATVAALALAACGPRDETPLSGGAAAVAPQSTSVAAPTGTLAPSSVAAPDAGVLAQGRPVPSAQATAVAPIASYAPPVAVATAAQSQGYAAPQYAPVPTTSSTAAVPAYPVAPITPVVQAVPSGYAGSIASIEPIRTRPRGSGAGAVIGGVLGAVVGNQFGHGLGRAAMTGAGAAGGAIAGNNVERNVKEGVAGYRIHVRLDNGSTRTFRRSSVGGLHVGERVRVDSGSFHRV
jgi:outer membrane lipoprotein SlyB